MTPEEFREIVKTMKEFGVSHIKMGDLELSMGDYPGVAQSPTKTQTPVDAPVPTDDPIENKVEQLTSLLKLSDNELVDTLFPDHTQQDNAEESA